MEGVQEEEVEEEQVEGVLGRRWKRSRRRRWRGAGRGGGAGGGRDGGWRSKRRREGLIVICTVST